MSPALTAVKPAGPKGFALTAKQQAQFHSQGYLVVPDFIKPKDIQALSSRVTQLLKDFEPSHTHSVFSTKNQLKKSDQYFLDSAANISFFLEEAALDEQGKFRQAKDLCVNKIGHALHDLDPVFRKFSRSDKISGILRSLGYRRPVPVQSMYIFKQPKIGGEVVPHQDSSFLTTDPLSCIGFWWALEDATKENGCLWAQPGIHKQGLLRKFIRTADGGVTFDKPSPQYDLSQFVPLECPAGSLVLLHVWCQTRKAPIRQSQQKPTFNWLKSAVCVTVADPRWHRFNALFGNRTQATQQGAMFVYIKGSDYYSPAIALGENIHYSAENHSPVSRHAYAMHVVESSPWVHWSDGNWMQRPDGMPWEPLYDTQE